MTTDTDSSNVKTRRRDLHPSPLLTRMAPTKTEESLGAILPCYLHGRSARPAVEARLLHRLNVSQAWSIPRGARLLDIGCGQGESTLVLATAVGPGGSVVGVDNAPADYGGPYTVGQAQQHILSSPLGPRVAFQRGDTSKWLAGNPSSAEFDGAVLCHSLWYFRSTTAVREMLESLAAADIPRVYVAEWSGEAGSMAQVPHALAAQAQMKLYRMRPANHVPRLHEQNVRGGALSHRELAALAQRLGWRVSRRGVIATPPSVKDGPLEARYLLGGGFSRDVEKTAQDEVARQELLDYQTKIAAVVKELESSGGSVQSMDTAWMVLERGQ